MPGRLRWFKPGGGSKGEFAILQRPWKHCFGAFAVSGPEGYCEGWVKGKGRQLWVPLTCG